MPTVTQRQIRKFYRDRVPELRRLHWAAPGSDPFGETVIPYGEVWIRPTLPPGLAWVVAVHEAAHLRAGTHDHGPEFLAALRALWGEGPVAPSYVLAGLGRWGLTLAELALALNLTLTLWRK